MTDSPEEFGPAMMALDERARKFVVYRIHQGMNPTQAAKSAGYSDKTDGYLRVQGHRLMRQKGVIAALREEAERKFDGQSAIALVKLGERAERKGAKVKDLTAITDRAGYGVQIKQSITVEHTDNRSTAELLAAVRAMMPRAQLPILDTTAEEVDAKTA